MGTRAGAAATLKVEPGDVRVLSAGRVWQQDAGQAHVQERTWHDRRQAVPGDDASGIVVDAPPVQGWPASLFLELEGYTVGQMSGSL